MSARARPAARWLAAPAVATLFAAGVWLFGGVVAGTFRTAMALTAGWFAVAGVSGRSEVAGDPLAPWRSGVSIHPVAPGAAFRRMPMKAVHVTATAQETIQAAKRRVVGGFIWFSLRDIGDGHRAKLAAINWPRAKGHGL